MTLANAPRTDIHAHRPLPADTELARAIAVLARAHQDATWRRTKATNELRSLLREYYPGFLSAFAHHVDDGDVPPSHARFVTDVEDCARQARAAAGHRPVVVHGAGAARRCRRRVARQTNIAAGLQASAAWSRAEAALDSEPP